jgi:hypothetical protein
MSLNVYGIIISNVDDLKFLRAGLREYANVFERISIAIGNHTWDGTPEDASAVDAFRAECRELYPNAVIITTYDVPADKDPAMQTLVTPQMYWEAHARRAALRALWEAAGRKAVDDGYLLFLDSDEIVEAAKFRAFLTHLMYVQDGPQIMKLSNYWYWRSCTYRARTYVEDSAVLMRGSLLDPGDTAVRPLFSNMGRHGLVDAVLHFKGISAARGVMGPDGTPMLHHYSWVRSEQDMLKKVKVWGHRDDRADWQQLVKNEFAGPFSGRDFLKGLTYDHVDNQFGIPI